MFTASAARSFPPDSSEYETVRGLRELVREGRTHSQIRAQLDARRWQRFARAVVLHAGPLTPLEAARVVLVNSGPRAAFTSFTAVEMLGLNGWHRAEVHIVTPTGARTIDIPSIRSRIHRVSRWASTPLVRAGTVHALAPALLLAAGSFDRPRPACGILAAAVQQRLIQPQALQSALTLAPNTRHRGVLLKAVADIGQGAQALSEIDFIQLCRRHRLPSPTRQAVRVEPSGRRRYLDAEWRRPGKKTVVAEVDGALHLVAKQWWDDQFRQNELVIGGDLVLRYPSVTLRTDEASVVDQLRRALAR